MYRGRAVMTQVKEDQAELKKRFREVAVTFEHREGSRLLDGKELPALICALGFNPSPEQLQLLQERISSYATEDQGPLMPVESIEEAVLGFLAEQKAGLVRDSYFTLLRAFRAFDVAGRGYIDAEQLREALCSCDGGLSTEEMNSMVGAAADSQGRVYYAEYAYKLATDGRTS